MANPSLRQEDIKTLEQMRQKLFTLTNNLGSLKNDVARSNPLPDWASLQTSATILAKNIQTLTDHLATHSNLLEQTVAYPSTNYPGRTQEDILVQLVRKRVEPPVEEWMTEGRAAQGETTTSEEELSKWAGRWIGERIAKYAMEEGGDDYTAEEREMGTENVNTGLRRTFEEDEDESSDEDEEMGGTGVDVDVTKVRKSSLGQVEFELGAVQPEKKRLEGPVRTLEDILEFGTRGELLPRQEMRR
ncbi:RNA polymerase ii mediator complex component [Phlyctema vagabunda]|uniref:Mediator of RNA polymerase II transcription subunit 8 n=1 Tax=Phlyctema vagabunda TaxID=108571 RepID=A0ABR4PRF1_9HELO